MAESENKRKSSSSSSPPQEEESSSSCEGATGRDQETSGSDDFDDLEELPSTVEKKFTRHNSRVSIDSISLSENGGLDFICVRRLAKSSAFRRKKSLEKDKQSKKSRDGARNKKRKRFWSFRFKKRLQGQLQRPCDMPVTETSVTSDGPSCVCTEIRRTDDHLLGPGIVFSATKSAQRRISDAQGSGNNSPVSERRTTTSPKADISHAELLQLVVPVPPERPCSSRSSGDDMDPFADIDEILATRRKQEIKEGIELSDAELQRFYPITGGSGTPPSYPATMGATGGTTSNDSVAVLANNLQARCSVKTVLHRGLTVTSDNSFNPYKCVLPQNLNPYPHRVHTQVDYIHCLVPDLQDITSCAFYWGVMDRYEAERLLEGKPQGTFLLRDSAQEEFLFSVSFRRYGRSLHARIEQWNHKFSFDSHDPGVFASDTVCGLIEHYKDPSCCMFFEPMLTIPLPRKFPFTLQHMCRSVISNQVSYDGIHYLPLPRSLKDYLKYYHYKQKVRVRRFELPH